MSRIIVQKFGGSSVADAAKMRACAERVREHVGTTPEPTRIIVVVSAMGDTTDDLLGLAQTATDPALPVPDRRELDQLLATGEQASVAMMAMVLKSCGIDSISLTAAQVGIRTDAAFGRATITSVATERLVRELDAGRVPVVAGFQGTTDLGEITTLGRGGSDTTAVAVASALRQAGHDASCDIYKDVDGVFTADPRVVPDARRREVVTFDEMLEAAAIGAQVIHPRAVELAKKFGVPLRVLHSHKPGPGTLILPAVPHMESRVVSSVVIKRSVARVSIRGLVNRPGIQSAVFGPVAAAGISIDDIIQEDDGPNTVCLTITFDRGATPELTPIIHRVADELRRAQADAPSASIAVRFDAGFCTISVVGAGMRTSPGVASVLFAALAAEAVRVENITTSEIRISCVVREQDAERAVRAAHFAFGLQSDDAEQTRAQGLAVRVREGGSASMAS